MPDSIAIRGVNANLRDKGDGQPVKIAGAFPLLQNALGGQFVGRGHFPLQSYSIAPSDQGNTLAELYNKSPWYCFSMRLQAFNITGDGAAHLLSSIAGAPTLCKWFQLLCNSGTMTVGGADTDATHGYPIPATGANFQPPQAQSMEFYDLSLIKYYLSNADTGVLLCAL